MKYIKEYNNYLNENFYKWFGNSKVVDSKGNPIIMYHGSPKINDIEVFSSKDGVYYFTEDKYEALRYTQGNFNDENLIKPFYIKAERIFDASNMNTDEKNDIFKLLDKNSEYIISMYKEYNIFNLDEYEIEVISEYGLNHNDNLDLCKYYFQYHSDNFTILEMDFIQEWIKSKGYDSYTTIESGGGILNIAVFSPNQIKSALNNNGDFNINSDNINEKKK